MQELFEERVSMHGKTEMIEKIFSMVGQEDNDCVFIEIVGFEPVHQFCDPRVRVPDFPIIKGLYILQILLCCGNSAVIDLSSQFPDESRPEYTPHFVTGAQVAVAVVHLPSGQVRVPQVVAVHDVGRTISPLAARGQVEGGIVMGLGAALMEEYYPGVSTGFSDYMIPTILSMPEMEIHLLEVPSLQGPFGAKGMGEAVMLPTAPAIINAVSRAIGARIREIPATPERVRRAILSQAADD